MVVHRMQQQHRCIKVRLTFSYIHFSHISNEIETIGKRKEIYNI